MQDTSSSKDICSKSSGRDDSSSNGHIAMVDVYTCNSSANSSHEAEDGQVDPANDTVLSMPVHDMSASTNVLHYIDQLVGLRILPHQKPVENCPCNQDWLAEKWFAPDSLDERSFAFHL
jgi:hypothetical protein